MDVVANVQRMPEAGETVHGDRFFMTGGGKGANQAVAAARLGAEVRMVGRVGDDDFGRTLLDALRSERIDVRRCRSGSLKRHRRSSDYGGRFRPELHC